MTAFGELAVTAVGGVTAVGATMAQTCASVRAGLMGFSEHPFYTPTTRDPGWDDDVPLLAAPVTTLAADLAGPARLVELAIAALRELAEVGISRRDLASSALLVSLPVRDEVVEAWGVAQYFAAALCKRSGLGSLETIVVTQSGHTGVLELLPRAAQLIAERKASRCIVLGVDTYLTEDRMALLDAGYRLKSHRAVDGFVPGEAGVALLVEDLREAERRGADIRCVIEGVGFGREPQTQSGDRHSSGAGLTGALATVARPEETPYLVCDLNGESYRSFEWGVATSRLGPGFAQPLALVHPAESFGDIGAASGAAHVAIAAASFARGYAPAPQAILWASSDGDLRAAARVSSPPRES